MSNLKYHKLTSNDILNISLPFNVTQNTISLSKRLNLTQILDFYKS